VVVDKDLMGLLALDRRRLRPAFGSVVVVVVVVEGSELLVFSYDR
jgi:hypothetical protein